MILYVSYVDNSYSFWGWTVPASMILCVFYMKNDLICVLWFYMGNYLVHFFFDKRKEEDSFPYMHIVLSDYHMITYFTCDRLNLKYIY